MSIEDRKAVIRRANEEIFNQKNVDLVDELMTANVIDHFAPPELQHGQDGVKEFFRQILAAFPDFRYESWNLTAEGDRIAWLATMQGTHEGEFMGIPPTGRSVTWFQMHMARFVGNRIAEHWGSGDTLDLMAQPGLQQDAGALAPTPR